MKWLLCFFTLSASLHAATLYDKAFDVFSNAKQLKMADLAVTEFKAVEIQCVKQYYPDKAESETYYFGLDVNPISGDAVALYTDDDPDYKWADLVDAVELQGKTTDEYDLVFRRFDKGSGTYLIFSSSITGSSGLTVNYCWSRFPYKFASR